MSDCAIIFFWRGSLSPPAMTVTKLCVPQNPENFLNSSATVRFQRTTCPVQIRMSTCIHTRNYYASTEEKANSSTSVKINTQLRDLHWPTGEELLNKRWTVHKTEATTLWTRLCPNSIFRAVSFNLVSFLHDWNDLIWITRSIPFDLFLWGRRRR